MPGKTADPPALTTLIALSGLSVVSLNMFLPSLANIAREFQADYALVNLCIALLASGIVVALVGQSPLEVLSALVKGALGNARGLSYTLYYTTTFIFTGLAVAVAFHEIGRAHV